MSLRRGSSRKEKPRCLLAPFVLLMYVGNLSPSSESLLFELPAAFSLDFFVVGSSLAAVAAASPAAAATGGTPPAAAASGCSSPGFIQALSGSSS